MVVTVEAKGRSKLDPPSVRSRMPAPMKAKRAPERDLFAALSEGMTALALLRPKAREAGTKARATRTAAVRF
jgi:hypothetical protein